METSTRIARDNSRKSGAQQYPPALPQWCINVLRPMARNLCSILWRTRYKGFEHVPHTGGVIIAANHQTYIDPFWVGFPLKRPLRFLAWDEAFNWPIVGRAMGLLGAWPLQIEGRDPASIRRALQWLREGGAVVIFPEGGRGMPDGSMVKFKNGAVRMALEANVPILPVTIRGGHRAWPKGKRFPRLAEVEIIYHPLKTVAPQPGEDTRLCARRESECLAEIIRSAL
jgi:1-acyl-sn-glycerol-3-phosphate acyltransferase